MRESKSKKSVEGTSLPKVMISYSSADSEFVDELLKVLERYQISAWIDKTGIKAGERWHDSLLRQLRECDVLIPVLSESFLASDPCKMELFIARSAGKRVIPIMHSQNLQYGELTRNPETKGLEDLFMFRIDDRETSEAMALTIPREVAFTRTCECIVNPGETIGDGLAYIAFLKDEVVLATQIAERLSKQGLKTWIATRDIAVGKNFMQEQISAMLHASALIIVMGEGIEKSGYIRTELNLAKAQGIRPFPVFPKRYSNIEARNALIANLRSQDHTYVLYETQAYYFDGYFDQFIEKLFEDLSALGLRNP